MAKEYRTTEEREHEYIHARKARKKKFENQLQEQEILHETALGKKVEKKQLVKAQND